MFYVGVFVTWILVVGFVTQETRGTAWEDVASVSAAVGIPVAAAMWKLWEQTRRRTAEASARRESAQVQRAAEMRAKESAERNLLSRLESLPGEVVRAYDRAAKEIEVADRQIDEAIAHRAQSALTPFWESCERALVALGNHGLHLQSATYLARQIDSVREELSKLTPGKLPAGASLPEGLDHPAALAVGSQLATRLQGLMYEAQTDFHFASIFEQRRTTSAVVAGFNSLSSAMQGMSSALTASSRDLREAITSVNGQTAEATESMNRHFDVYSGTANLGTQVRQINERLSSFSREAR